MKREEDRLKKEKEAQREAELEQLTPAERAVRLVEDWGEQTWSIVLGDVNILGRRDEHMQRALIQALAGPEVNRWEELKRKAQSQKKKDKATRPIVEKIYAIAKRQNPQVEMP